ncbi:MAG: excinuclease ABC subunit UvrA, partial [Sporomusa sp.]
KNKKHTIEVVVDRIVVRDGVAGRLADSLETSLKLGGGVVSVDVSGANELMFSQNFACVDCGISLPEIAPRMFSFNSPFGACADCTGLGNNLEIDSALVIPDPGKAFIDGVIAPLSKSSNSYFMCQLEAVLENAGQTLYDTWENTPDNVKETILWGSGQDKFTFRYENMYGENKTYHAAFEGVIPLLSRRHRESTSDWSREEIEEYMSSKPCPACKGARLKPEALAVKIGGKNINEVTRMTVAESKEFFDGLELTERETVIARQILKEINARLGFLLNVGLDYLTLDRAAGTLSGGEAQRIRLATQIGSGLVGVLYILDEPSIGLHQRDNNRLLNTLKHMRDLGNTLIVVEHDEDTMYAADHIIDIG